MGSSFAEWSTLQKFCGQESAREEGAAVTYRRS